MRNILSGLILLFFAFISAANAQEKAPVYVLKMDGAISPAFSDYLDQGIAAAVKNNAQLLLVELDTPGGLLTSTRDMVTSILESPVPVAVWVTPPGSHAASAGTFILYASHIAAMDNGTNIGAATPIEMGNPLGQPPGSNPEPEKEPAGKDAAGQKALEDTAAFIRGLAEIRGRNAEWAEAAVTKAESITASEALDLGVIDLIASSREQLLSSIDGRKVEAGEDKTVTLRTKDAPVTGMKPDFRIQFLSFISDPNLAFILLTIGVWGLVLEFYNPGTLVPGTIGVV